MFNNDQHLLQQLILQFHFTYVLQLPTVMSTEQVIAAAAFLILNDSTRKKRRKRQLWKRAMFRSGYRNSLLKDILSDDGLLFNNFTRLSASDFEELLLLISPLISKQDTRFQDCIPSKVRLAITLRFLATGDSYKSLMYLFKVSYSTISTIVPEVCQAITLKLQDYIKCPVNEEEWKSVAQNFEVKWNFPHCIGAIDGKHIVIQAPANSGSQFYNYKHTFSIVLMAVVDANYNFIYAHVGCQGRISDGGVFKNTEFYKLLDNNRLNLPSPVQLQGRSIKSPFVFVGDDAFPLRKDLLKPYSGQLGRSPERVFNYRLSRARRISENVFGILSASFRIFRKPINLNLNNTQAVTTACIYLYNFMRRQPLSGLVSFGNVDVDDPATGIVSEGRWRATTANDMGIVNLPRRPIRPNQAAWDVRQEFKDYFMTPEGRIEWQENYA